MIWLKTKLKQSLLTSEDNLSLASFFYKEDVTVNSNLDKAVSNEA